MPLFFYFEIYVYVVVVIFLLLVLLTIFLVCERETDFMLLVLGIILHVSLIHDNIFRKRVDVQIRIIRYEYIFLVVIIWLSPFHPYFVSSEAKAHMWSKFTYHIIVIIMIFCVGFYCVCAFCVQKYFHLCWYIYLFFAYHSKFILITRSC